MIDEKWLKGEVIVSRDRFANIITQEMARVKTATMMTNENLWPFMEDFLLHYSACIAEELFRPTTMKEEQLDREKER